jgi:hypothetical protein
MPSQKTRAAILDELLETLRKNGGRMSFYQLFGTIAYKYGTTEKTYLDYLYALKMTGKIDYPDYKGPGYGSLKITLL